jgi:hypothetical protein
MEEEFACTIAWRTEATAGVAESTEWERGCVELRMAGLEGMGGMFRRAKRRSLGSLGLTRVSSA